jgi:hypothetical protein
MFRPVEVLGGVFVFGGIATSNVPADEAEPQVHPRVAHFEAFFAARFIRLLELDLIEMCTVYRHILNFSVAR